MSRKKNEALLEYEKKTKEATQKKIIQTIEELKNHFKKISVASISRESGISRTTLYAYKDLIDKHLEPSKKITELSIKEIENLIDENIKLKKILEKLGHSSNCTCSICKNFQLS